MIVFLILAWLHSSAGVDCTVLSLQMTSIWTVSIWHGFIYVGFRKAIFKWVSHFLTSFVLLTHQTLLWSFSALRWALNSTCPWLLNTCLQRNMHFWAIWENLIAHNSTPKCWSDLLSSKGQGLQRLHPDHHHLPSLVGMPDLPTFTL